jgi:hypothetical protein
MYRMVVTVTEYLGTFGVKAALNDRDDVGYVHYLADTPETFYDDDAELLDALECCFVALRKWATFQMNSGRVAPGVSDHETSS